MNENRLGASKERIWSGRDELVSSDQKLWRFHHYGSGTLLPRPGESYVSGRTIEVNRPYLT